MEQRRFPSREKVCEGSCGLRLDPRQGKLLDSPKSVEVVVRLGARRYNRSCEKNGEEILTVEGVLFASVLEEF